MPSPRTSGTRGSSSRAPARPAQSSVPPGLIVAGAIIVLVAAYIAFTSGGGGGESTAAANQTKPPAPVVKQEAPKPKSTAELGTAKAGKTPKRPAPAIDTKVYEKTDGWYDQSRKLFEDGQKLRDKGDSAAFQKKMHEAWDLMELIGPALETYTTWEEEANMADWAVPAEYDALRKRLARYDELRMKLKRSKTREK
jgi:hypothetical protein